MSDIIKSFAKSIADKNLANKVKETSVEGVVSLVPTNRFWGINATDMLVKSIRSINSMSKSFLEKKVLYFLFGVKDVDIEKRHEFINKYVRGNEESISELTFITLDKIDRLSKAKILSNLFIALSNELINDEIYLRLMHSLAFIYYDDLIYLKELYGRKDVIENYRLLSLSSYGLLESKSPNRWGSERNTYYNLSELGIELIRCGIDPDNYSSYMQTDGEDK